MRASAGGGGPPREELARMHDQVERAGLVVSMVTADSDVPLNNEHGPDSLRNIGPSLDVAEAAGVRVAHQCHTTTLFEEVEPSIALLERINRRNFGLIYEPINLLVCGQSYGLATLRKFGPYLMNA